MTMSRALHTEASLVSGNNTVVKGKVYLLLASLHKAMAFVFGILSAELRKFTSPIHRSSIFMSNEG